MFRKPFALLVVATVALAGCSRNGATASRETVSGPVAVATAGEPGLGGTAAAAVAAADAGPAVAESGTAPGDAAEAAAEAAKEPKGPFLWRVEGKTPLYLFGTIHVPDDRVLALPAPVEKAFTESTAVYTEIPMDSATQLSVMGKVMLPEGQQLSDVIGEALYQRMMNAAGKTLGGEHAGLATMLGPLFQRMKPWAAMSQLSLLEFLPEMMAGKQPLDAMLYARAQSSGKKVGALETPEQQIAVFESFTAREQTRMLELTLDEIERVKPGERTQTQALIDAYLSGDMNVVNEVLEDAMAGDKALMSRFQDIAITRRNNHMTERIQALRREQPSTVFFVAVGTAHYAGPTGIVAQLQKAGLKVTRVGS
jgi:uncharacterized protein YbaP (TraB family)